jgi:hypothetical protein
LDVCCDSCVLSGRGLCDGPIPRPEESYRLWCVTEVHKPSTLAVGVGTKNKWCLKLITSTALYKCTWV